MVRYDNYSPGAQNNNYIISTRNEEQLRNTVQHEVQHGRKPNDSYELLVVVAVMHLSMLSPTYPLPGIVGEMVGI